MNQIEDFGTTQKVEVLVLVDNNADLIVKSTNVVKRFKDKPLLAEHGLAALIDLKDAGIRILWDAGVTEIALLENARRMKIDLTTIDKIALSHGHSDHTAALTEVLKAMERRPKARKWDKGTMPEAIRDWVQGHRVPVIVHPAAFRERWRLNRDGSRYGPVLPSSREEWEAAGARVILTETPYELGPGCWTTGPVPRDSFEKAGTPSSMAYREGDKFKRDKIDDDQAIVISIKKKGLVVVAGCAHAGIVNTVNHAKAISGVDKVCTILGGFHLAPAKDEEIQRTIDEIKSMKPKMVVPSHCTGFNAIRQFAAQMPDAFVQGAVGTRFLF